jgi:hypothetical protein
MSRENGNFLFVKVYKDLARKIDELYTLHKNDAHTDVGAPTKKMEQITLLHIGGFREKRKPPQGN